MVGVVDEDFGCRLLSALVPRIFLICSIPEPMMLGGGGSRISHHLRESSYLRHHQLGFCKTRIVQLSSLIFTPSSVTIIADNCNNRHFRLRLKHRMVSSFSLQSKSSGEIPIVSDCFRFYFYSVCCSFKSPGFYCSFMLCLD